MGHHRWSLRLSTFVGAFVIAMTLAGTSGAATSPPFTSFQLNLEGQLNARQAQLQKLSANVQASATIATGDRSLLSARLSNEIATIGTLILKVPNDTRWAQLGADRSAMVRDNRVFAVMTPQIRGVIAADSLLAMASSFSGQIASMTTSVGERSTDPGFAAATKNVTNFSRTVSNAMAIAAAVPPTVLSQSASGYPRNQRVFDHVTDQLQKATSDLTRASSMATSIALFVGANPAV